MAAQTLKDKVVLITGGAKNLGGLISRKFAEQGAKLTIHYNSESSKADAEKTLAEVKALGIDAILLQADLSSIDRIEELLSKLNNILVE